MRVSSVHCVITLRYDNDLSYGSFHCYVFSLAASFLRYSVFVGGLLFGVGVLSYSYLISVKPITLSVSLSYINNKLSGIETPHTLTHARVRTHVRRTEHINLRTLFFTFWFLISSKYFGRFSQVMCHKLSLITAETFLDNPRVQYVDRSPSALLAFNKLNLTSKNTLNVCIINVVVSNCH